MPTDRPERSRTRSRQGPAIAGCCGVPLLVAAVVVWLYVSSNRPVYIPIPAVQIPNPNGYDDFVRAGKLAVGMKQTSPISMPRPVFTYAAFRAAAMDAQPAIAAMRQGFGKESMCPAARTVQAVNRPMTELATFRELARVESGVGIYYEMDGLYAKAAETNLDSLEFSVTIPRGGGLIHGLVGQACEAIALSRFELPLAHLTEPELAHVAARLDKIKAKRFSLADIIQEEGCRQAISCEGLVGDPKSHVDYAMVREMLSEDDPANPGAKRINVKQGWEAAKFVFSDKGKMIRENLAYAAACAAEARGPYQGPFKTPMPTNVLAQFTGISYSTVRARFVATEAAEAVIRAEVALERFRLANGRFPARLSELPPRFIASSGLTDPCGGGVLHYAMGVNGKTFKLYSIGPDLVDNAGTPSRYVGSGPGDIVAGAMRKNHVFTKSGK